MSKQQTVIAISKLLKEDKLSKETLEELKLDQRVGVQKLLTQYERKKEREAQQVLQYQQMLSYEKEQYNQGKDWIAGIDEAGRGPLAGPVVAAAVILKKDFYLAGLNDSKQINKDKREAFYSIIKEEAVSYGIGVVHHDEIDCINIFQATKKAMKIAIEQLNPLPDHVLVDAVQLEDLLCTSEAIIKGDQKSVSIAAASILAKVTRDHFMEDLHNKYPVYNFLSNKGYGTREHLDAISKYGICTYHRKTFTPVNIQKSN